jgi:hypothetical protein
MVPSKFQRAEPRRKPPDVEPGEQLPSRLRLFQAGAPAMYADRETTEHTNVMPVSTSCMAPEDHAAWS